jgi:uncharacterized protein (DUF2236 family)
VSRQLFFPNSVIWKVDREMALLLGGGRALLMQLAHPKVASGVADHSHFGEDPLDRLHRTMNTMWSIVFDDIDQTEAALRRVKTAHQNVRGVVREASGLPEGTTYDALDPELLLWVHATLVDSALTTYELFVQPLSARDKEQYYEGTMKLAALFEIPTGKVPPSLEAFDAYMRAMIDGDTLVVIPAARQLAGEILYPRPWTIRLAGPLFAFITAGLLPPKLREGYCLTWNERKSKKLGRLGLVIRGLLPMLPPALRIVPHARAAHSRLARATR